MAISEFMPHADSMCLLDRLVHADEECLHAEADIRAGNLFVHNGEMGAWVGIEYMAQAVAAWAGWHARRNGEAPRIGLLLGTRRYNSRRTSFRVGESLRIEIRRELQAENGLGVFDCRIMCGDQEAASASLNVYQPADQNELLK